GFGLPVAAGCVKHVACARRARIDGCAGASAGPGRGPGPGRGQESKTAGRETRRSAVIQNGTGSGAGRPLQALLEPLDLAGRVDDRLLAREERVAVGADVDPELRARGSNGPLGATASAVDLRFVILGMDVGLHECALLRRRPCRAIAQPVIAGYWLRGQAFAAADLLPIAADAAVIGASTASTRIRFLFLVACSNLTFPVSVANTV